MKAALIGLAIAAVLAVAEGTTLEDLEMYISGLEEVYIYRTAKLINADKITEVTFKAKTDHIPPGEADFIPTSEPMAADAEDAKCGNRLGIQIGDRYFCGLSYLIMDQNLFMRSGQIFRIFLEFKSPTSPNDILRIKTSVFTTPEKLKGEALQDWAKEKKMIASPFDEADLKGLYESGTITLKLDWVARLAEYGVYEDEEVPFPNNEENGFFYDASLRPIAVPSSVISQLEEVYDKYMNDDDSCDHDH